jgi:hypothetical protein
VNCHGSRGRRSCDPAVGLLRSLDEISPRLLALYDFVRGVLCGICDAHGIGSVRPGKGAEVGEADGLLDGELPWRSDDIDPVGQLVNGNEWDNRTGALLDKARRRLDCDARTYEKELELRHHCDNGWYWRCGKSGLVLAGFQYLEPLS